LTPLPPGDLARRWAALNPGPLAHFALPDGSELLLRWVDRPSRALHPAEDCYRGQGYALTPLPPVSAPAPVTLNAPESGRAKPVLWRRFRATRDGAEWEVRSLILSQGGETYPDPGWWWWKTNGPGASDRGPWWAVTLQRRR
ncbi:MAG TPA: hypothetical protein VK689_21345, partial [Armatimonadota bacterium]|nr:hypothetical protein [Armatimonadota bacterium]